MPPETPQADAANFVRRLRQWGDERLDTQHSPTRTEMIFKAADEIERLSAELQAAKEALMLAEKADRIHSKCRECEDMVQAPEACGHCFPSADDARVARRNFIAGAKIKMRDVDSASPATTPARADLAPGIAFAIGFLDLTPAASDALRAAAKKVQSELAVSSSPAPSAEVAS